MWLRSVPADASPSPDTSSTHRRRIYNGSTLLTNWHVLLAELHSENGKPSRSYPHKLTRAMPLVLAPFRKTSKGSSTRASSRLHLAALWCIRRLLPYARHRLTRWRPLRRTIRHCSVPRLSPANLKLRNATPALPRCTASARTPKKTIPHLVRLSLWQRSTRLYFAWPITRLQEPTVSRPNCSNTVVPKAKSSCCFYATSYMTASASRTAGGRASLSRRLSQGFSLTVPTTVA
jgi:hypothetical protein